MFPKDSYAEHILHIKQALQENRLAVFIGAGFSKAFNNNYPSWGELIDKLKEAMPNIQTSDFLQIAEYYRLEFGNIYTKDKLKSYFPYKDEPSELHKKLIELYPHYIITTNWDEILEESLKETYLSYDIVANDKELQTSTCDHKIIKMHGDFNHDNYVFTESDYFNYSKNFPLIETFLKEIFTTHTILFLGYGFADINLKLVMTWLQNNLITNRTHYMLITKKGYNDYNQKYSFRYGITLLNHNDKEEHFSQEDYNNFLNQLTSKKFELENTTPEDYIYNQLKPLENLKHVLFSQISQALTNCNVMISTEGYFIQFYDQTLTTDYNKGKRELYKNFYDNLNKNGNALSSTQQKIISILQKAFIDGIYLGDDFYPSDPYIFLKTNIYSLEILNKLLFFNFNVKDKVYPNNEILQLLHEITCCYNLSQYEEALNCCERLMKLSLVYKKYDYYFISLWNYNAIIFELKYNYIPKKVPQENNKSWKNPYKDYENKYLEVVYNRMPYSARIHYKDIYKFLTWEFLDSKLIETQNVLSEKKAKIAMINKGGFAFTNESPKEFYLHQNLIFFILENGILMEKVKPFKQNCKNYFQIGLLRKKINNQKIIDLSLTEIYSAIKYFTTAELEDFFNELNTENTKISIAENTINILIKDIFDNCLTVYTTSHSQDFTTYICNILFLLQHVQFSKDNFKIIIEKINKTIASANNHIYFFDAMNSFYIAQYNLFTQPLNFPIKEIFNGIITLLYKLANDEINFYEYNVIRNNSLYYICSIASLCKYTFNDEELLKLLTLKFKKYDNKEKIYLITSVFINLFNISTEECKVIINIFIEQIKEIITNKQFDIDVMYYELSLVNIYLHEISTERINDYITYIEEMNKKDIYDSRINNIRYLLETIKKNNRQESLQNQFDKLYTLVKDIIEFYKERLKNIPSSI